MAEIELASRFSALKASAEKLLSGRLFLTIIAGVLLFKIGIAKTGDQAVQVKIFDIIEMIVMFYFLKAQDAKPTDEQPK